MAALMEQPLPACTAPPVTAQPPFDVLAAIAVRFRVYITRSNNTGSVDTQTNRRAGGAARTRGRQGGTIVSMIDRLVWLTCDP